MCEFAPARARREAQESRANRTLARPSCPAPMTLVTFPERKVTRAVGRRGKRHGCRTAETLDPGIRRDDGKHACPASAAKTDLPFAPGPRPRERDQPEAERQ